MIAVKKSSHPWLDDACRLIIQAKNDAEGTTGFEVAQQQCAQQLRHSQHVYLQILKQRIASLPKSDKRWWALNRQLLYKKAKATSVPPLKTMDGRWIFIVSSLEVFDYLWMFVGRSMKFRWLFDFRSIFAGFPMD